MESVARKTLGSDTEVVASARDMAAPNDIDRLKNLLFLPEAQRLAKIEAIVGSLDTRIGTQDRLQNATAQVLVEALRKAEVANHEQLSQAIAPVVVSVIRNEIANSKDMMVEALYPITGRLVSAGIGVAFAEMLAQINARLDALLSVNQFKLRVLAWRTGRPVSELMLAQTQRAKLQRLLFMERGSGHLLAQWQADHGTDARADLLSGMLAALQNFAQSALGEDGGQLRTLVMGEQRIYLRTSASHIVAAEFDGRVQPNQQTQLDREFYDLLDASSRGNKGDDVALADFAASLTCVGAVDAPRQPKISPLAVLGLLAMLVIGWFSWGAWQNWHKKHAVEASLHGFVTAHPSLAGWPLHVETDNRHHIVNVKGLVFEAKQRDELASDLGQAAAPYALSMQVGIVSTSASLQASEAKSTALAKQLEQDNAQLASTLKRLQGTSKQTHAQLDAAQTALNNVAGSLQNQSQQQAQFQVQVAELVAQAELPRAKLNAALAGFAIFFDEGVNVLDVAAVKAKLASIVPLALAVGGVRVMGFTDGTGGSIINRKLSFQRAHVVAQMLIDLGLPETAVEEIARGAAAPLASAESPQSKLNRRVELAPFFDGELQK